MAMAAVVLQPVPVKFFVGDAFLECVPQYSVVMLRLVVTFHGGSTGQHTLPGLWSDPQSRTVRFHQSIHAVLVTPTEGATTAVTFELEAVVDAALTTTKTVGSGECVIDPTAVHGQKMTVVLSSLNMETMMAQLNVSVTFPGVGFTIAEGGRKAAAAPSSSSSSSSSSSMSVVRRSPTRPRTQSPAPRRAAPAASALVVREGLGAGASAEGLGVSVSDGPPHAEARRAERLAALCAKGMDRLDRAAERRAHMRAQAAEKARARAAAAEQRLAALKHAPSEGPAAHALVVYAPGTGSGAGGGVRAPSANLRASLDSASRLKHEEDVRMKEAERERNVERRRLQMKEEAAERSRRRAADVAEKVAAKREEARRSEEHASRVRARALDDAAARRAKHSRPLPRAPPRPSSAPPGSRRAPASVAVSVVAAAAQRPQSAGRAARGGPAGRGAGPDRARRPPSSSSGRVGAPAPAAAPAVACGGAAAVTSVGPAVAPAADNNAPASATVPDALPAPAPAPAPADADARPPPPTRYLKPRASWGDREMVRTSRSGPLRPPSAARAAATATAPAAAPRAARHAPPRPQSVGRPAALDAAAAGGGGAGAAAPGGAVGGPVPAAVAWTVPTDTAAAPRTWARRPPSSHRRGTAPSATAGAGAGNGVGHSVGLDDVVMSEPRLIDLRDQKAAEEEQRRARELADRMQAAEARRRQVRRPLLRGLYLSILI